MTTALFLASTPLHSFWSLGLAHGPFRDGRCALALIDQRDGDRDFIAEVLAARSDTPVREVRRFPRIGKNVASKLRNARRVIGEVAELSRRLQPAHVVVGNDRRIEFYAALAGTPEAVGAYIDDGMFSYMPMFPRQTPAPLRAGNDAVRRWLYGLPAEHPPFVGGSRAAREAWVMLPELVHQGLRGKTTRGIDAAWFRDEGVRRVCADAVGLAGVDARRIGELRLLLLLPHDAFLRENPDIARQIGRLAREHAARGLPVAFKRHPRSTATDTGLLPAGALEIPRRLPVEVLAPLLNDVLVVGTLTTALISLKYLGASTQVRSLSQKSVRPDAAAVYAAAGIAALDALRA
ncbi:MAG: hypothetical protein QM661_13460 [Solimonas sp.]